MFPHWEDRPLTCQLFVLQYVLATGSMTITYFIPTLVGTSGLGYTGSMVQYMTSPICKQRDQRQNAFC